MLKLTVKTGEYLQIGEDIRIVFTGGMERNIHVLVDAPKSYNVVRSTVLEKQQSKGREVKKYYRDNTLSDEAKQQITDIIRKDRLREKQTPVR